MFHQKDFIDINGEPRHDYLLLRTYDPRIEEILCSLEDGAPIYVEGRHDLPLEAARCTY